MNTLSAHQVAALGATTPPRVLRASKALGFEAAGAQPRRKRRFDARQTKALLARLAPHPVPVAGFSVSECRVLAALAGAPLGLASARAVARAAGMSPATASRVLLRLVAIGLVRRQQRRIAAGSVRDRELLILDVTHPEWPELAPQLSTFRKPPEAIQGGVPARLGHVFWNEELRALDPDRQGAFIAKRVLDTKDPQALAWAARRLPPHAWARAAQARGIDPRDAALALILAAQDAPTRAAL